jgi:citrate synthase
MGAAQAAAALGVSRPTLYAYVSRGAIRSQSVPGSPRERAYARDDVERLRRRTDARRDPDLAAAGALHWGLPILESAITLIDGRRLYYRGHDVVALARSRSVEDVARLVWLGRFDGLAPAGPGGGSRPARRPPAARPFVPLAQALLAAAAPRDEAALDLRPEAAAACGWRILRLLTRAATGSDPGAQPIDQALARAWRVPGRGRDVLRATLILCADHELNVSSFTARAVASAGANPYAVVIAGLSALEGIRHGGASARVEAMLGTLRREPDLRRAIAARLRRGDPIDGFGHPLYPGGDPRAAMLLALLRAHGRSTELDFVTAVADAAAAAVGEGPNLDFALAAVARALRLAPGAPLMLFALGRTIGWIGHAIEQYATGQLIRPRARYIGVVPDNSQRHNSQPPKNSQLPTPKPTPKRERVGGPW